MYKFRVAVIVMGGILYSEPSEPFIVDMPNVHIKPYWISESMPEKIEIVQDEKLKVRVDALGTPRPCFHWIKNGNEDIFIEDDGTVDIT